MNAVLSKTRVTDRTSSPLVIIRSEAARLVLERQQMQGNISPFIKKCFKTVDPGATYMHNWHIDLISEYLMAAWKRQIKDIIFNMPPRFMKSLAITVSFPAWGLGKNPSEQFLCGSYSADLSKNHSVYCRKVIESDWYQLLFPETIIAKDQNEKKQYDTTKGGHRIAVSVGGTVTGKGGNVKILDDPVNPKEALSDPQRKEANTWIDQTWSSRNNDPNKAIDILVMQRLHVNDPTGHLKENGDYEHVIIPQVADRKTIVIFPISKKKKIRKKGELLHPERFNQEQVNKSKKRMGTYGFAGQQQQRPTPLKGGRIDLGWFPRFKVTPVEFDEIVLSCDTAQKEKEINDPTVIEVYGRVGNRWYLIHVFKERINYPKLKTAVTTMINRWKPDAVLIEDKSSGTSLIQDLKENTTAPVIAIEPEANKIIRMDTQTPSIEAGLISLPSKDHEKEHDWTSELEENILNFPNPNEWDEIDAMSQFIKWTKERDQGIELW